jgi:Fe-S cluster assembly ATPase SufC
MRPGLGQHTQLKQELKINPRLYQAMDLLYMPLLDLQQHLKQELLNNPFLDMIEPEEEDEEEGETQQEEATAETEAEKEEKGEIDWEEILLDGFDAGGRREEHEERDKRLETLLGELKIEHLRHSKAFQLSGGERRRLEITRALVTQPKFMMLDEPFAGVDPIAVHDIQTIVAGLRHRGIGVLISDHNVEQTLDIVDRAYIMFEGQVKVSGTVRELVFDDEVADIYLGPTLTARLRARFATESQGTGESA